MTPLKAARLKKGWTVPQAAAEIRINKGNYYRIEMNQVGVGPALADKIAKVFGNLVTRDQILFPDDYPMPEEEPVEAKAS